MEENCDEKLLNGAQGIWWKLWRHLSINCETATITFQKCIFTSLFLFWKYLEQDISFKETTKLLVVIEL